MILITVDALSSSYAPYVVSSSNTQVKLPISTSVAAAEYDDDDDESELAVAGFLEAVCACLMTVAV